MKKINDSDEFLKNASKEECELFVKTENGETYAGIHGRYLPLLLNAVALVQQLLTQTGIDKVFFDYLYKKTTTNAYGKRDWK